MPHSVWIYAVNIAEVHLSALPLVYDNLLLEHARKRHSAVERKDVIFSWTSSPNLNIAVVDYVNLKV